jgi:hypothetical protein
VKTLATKLNKIGDKGSPCFKPFPATKIFTILIVDSHTNGCMYQTIRIQLLNLRPKPLETSISSKNSEFTRLYFSFKTRREECDLWTSWIISCAKTKGGHERARAGLGASRILARENLARLRLARWSFGPKKWARPELTKNWVQLELARPDYMNIIVQICAKKLSM